jgi:mannan endo-1,4-beta-mannosidase
MRGADLFVQVHGTEFTLSGSPYAFAGINFWYAPYLGQAGVEGDRARLGRELDLLQQNGVTNLRLLAASEPTPYAPLTTFFQPAPGQYNESLLRGLDYVLDQMDRRGQKAVLYLNNQWEWSGGMATYVEWATGEQRPAATQWPATLRFDVRFFSLPRARACYHQYVRMLVTRTNTENGRVYAEDPTIMSWQLANEPRAGAAGELAAVADNYLSWVDESTSLLRHLAPHQLISTGSEGSVGSGDSQGFYEKVHALPGVDYLTAHIWPFNWGWFRPKESAATLPYSEQKTREYLQAHVASAQILGKPLVLEEFGLPRDEGRYVPGTSTTARDAYVLTVCNLLRTARAARSPLSGLNLWTWAGEGVPADPAGALWRPGDPFCGDNGNEPQGINAVYSSDHTTLAHLRQLNLELASSAGALAQPISS